MPRPRSLAVLVSGQGRNLGALIDACADGRVPARIASVISNRPGVSALDRAASAGIAATVVPHSAFARRDEFDAALAKTIDASGADLVILAGFMRVLGDDFVRRYEGRMLNIHPSLLPKYPGLHTHRRALEAGDAQAGATVHFVTPALDGGPRVIQGGVSVLPQDTETTLSERVMQDVELRIYPQAVAWLSRGDLALEAGHVRFRGAPLTAPLTMDDVEPGFLR